MDRNDTYFEGCGKEGPINCIFLAEFHPVAGPKITCQVPDDFISKDTFEAVSVYIIPKAQLQRCTLTINSKLSAFRVDITTQKGRAAERRTTGMEVETGFLSQQEEAANQQEPSNRTRLVNMLNIVLQDLNKQRMCTLSGKLKHHSSLPQHHFTSLITLIVLPFIDGINHVAKIAVEADVEANLVKACLQNLEYYGVVRMIPIFQYSNVYVPTSKLHRLTINKRLQDDCLRTVARAGRQIPSIRDVFRLYSNMAHGTTVRDLCIRFDPVALRVDEKRLVQFGVLEGLIRRVHKYPVMLCDDGSTSTSLQHFTGLNSLDEICCSTGISKKQIEDQVEKDPNIIFLWK
ncbi:GATOR complex protein NPRL2 [Nilaparvata lugens]|uniref:GATOR complex protein NPRL2 n=1 Tax=Nilaparvata lugens TaxID=108931 RepID=UPI00193E23AA|nr:GATOR complex protein NPRL2 [Nilaparvata lugens]